ncbi:hypothetical protein GTA08_BOTSDO00778 [Neofusicoccum parvum]|uniref:Uncharacterized protein n=1 Tax=Neofusicoccum parvum TaxID=310453 RepID=A0ACB5S506_9PEZI|nr:hypothetical protein GTA08_BOTSDO00778 [Neofusicoccum parvum]
MSHEADETAQELEQQRQQAPKRPLPAPRAFLTDLLTSLPGSACGRDGGNGAIAHEDGTTTRVSSANTSAPAAASSVANPLRALQGKDRNVFLTLHVLFPNELLPALDLLDRGLVTRFLVVRPRQPPPQPPPARAGEAEQTTATAAPGSTTVAAAETVSHGQAAAALATSSRVEISNAVGVSDTASGRRDGGSSSSSSASASAPINTTAPQPPPAPPAADPAAPEPCPASATPAKRDHAAERAPPPPPPAAPTPSLYYVRSAQQQQHQPYHHRSRFGRGDADAHPPRDSGPSAPSSYEVRLAAWNCSCPAFAFAAFPANLAAPSPSPPPASAEGGSSHGVAAKSGGEGAGEDGLGQFGFGGLRRGAGGGQVPPVCKHLLACLLVERAPGLFWGCVEERVVGVEEAAAWAAGWGG